MRKPGEVFKPLADRVLVRRAKVSEGNMLIPERFADLKDRGYVVAVGPGRPGVPMTLKVGDKVVFARHAPLETTNIDNEEFLILYEAEIAGILE